MEALAQPLLEEPVSSIRRQIGGVEEERREHVQVLRRGLACEKRGVEVGQALHPLRAYVLSPPRATGHSLQRAAPENVIGIPTLGH